MSTNLILPLAVENIPYNIDHNFRCRCQNTIKFHMKPVDTYRNVLWYLLYAYKILFTQSMVLLVSISLWRCKQKRNFMFSSFRNKSVKTKFWVACMNQQSGRTQIISSSKMIYWSKSRAIIPPFFRLICFEKSATSLGFSHLSLQKAFAQTPLWKPWRIEWFMMPLILNRAKLLTPPACVVGCFMWWWAIYLFHVCSIKGPGKKWQY